jgi:hypothetical protein
MSLEVGIRKENTMTAMMSDNGRTQRKTLARQIDRLDSVLDGLAEALNGSVATAVKEVVGQVVREAVETAVREVLSNPELLRAALAKHEPAPAPLPTKPKRRTVTESLLDGWTWLCQKTTTKVVETRKALGVAWNGCVQVLTQVRKETAERWTVLVGYFAVVWPMLVLLILGMWRFRRTCAVAMSIGLAAGIAGYFAGPVIAAAMCGLGGAMLTVSGLILVPLAKLLLTENPLQA